LSSPFLNIHWFFDKLNMTGSNLQWYNGMLLLGMFFSCRIIWGTWQSIVVYIDMWHALMQSRASTHSPFLDGVPTNAPVFKLGEGAALCINEDCIQANAEIAKFAHHFTDTPLPQWLPIVYVAANLILNTLNYYWFSQMIEAVLKRFRAPPAAAAAKKAEEILPPQEAPKAITTSREPDYILDAAKKLKQVEGYFETGDAAELAVPATGADATGADFLRERKTAASS
jgi:TLC domain